MPFVFVIGLALVVMAAQEVWWTGVFTIAGVLLVAFIIIKIKMNKIKRREVEKTKDLINQILKDKEDLIDRTALHTIKRSHMGVVKMDRFQKEIEEFIDSEVGYLLRRNGSALSYDYRTNLIRKICGEAFSRIEKNRQIPRPVGEMTPVEYEVACANLFKRKGWDTTMTSTTGDQGVDIIITKGTKKGVVQCKRYAAPVGNKAVQEIAAGRSHYRASIAIVVGPSGFTKSARQLAESTDVHLLHHDEIQRFSA